VIHLEPLPRWLRVAIRAALFAFVVCLIVSILPVWKTWDAHKAVVRADDRGVFWEEVAHATVGDKQQPGIFLKDNLKFMAIVAGLAFGTGFAAFWFGPRVKDGEDEPRKLRVRMWDS
jgi:hypothetical protein